jgi:hypothetical protein
MSCVCNVLDRSKSRHRHSSPKISFGCLFHLQYGAIFKKGKYYAMDKALTMVLVSLLYL